MTIQCVFSRFSDRIAIRIIGDNILFIDLVNNVISPIEGLNISKEGVKREFPDLENDKEWKQKAIKRFVEKIKSFESEDERSKWIIKEMKDMGYTPLYKQRDGFRQEKIT